MTPRAQPGTTERSWRGLEGLERLVAIGAVAKIAACLMLLAAYWPVLRAGAFSPFVQLAHVVAFGGAAVFLTMSSGRDRRAFHLGGFFLLVAVSFANGLVYRLDHLDGLGLHVQQVLLGLHPDAFLPYFLWQFVSQFPRLFRFDRGQGLERAFLRATTAAGLIGILATAVASLAPGQIPEFIGAFAWRTDRSWFDTIMFGLALPALPFGLWKARRADVRERRRYRLFVAGQAVGFLPIAVQVLAEAMAPSYGAFMDVQPRRALLGYLVLYPLLLSIPLTTTYAVVVHRVMDVKVLVRTALRYALARFTIVALAAVPAVTLVASMVRNRNQTIGDLFSAPNALSVLLPLGVLLVALATRRALLARIDRWFFREAVDTRALLDALTATAIRSGATLETVCAAYAERLQSLLHLAQADVLVADRESRSLSSAAHRLRPLPLDSPLASALAARPDAIVIELDDPDQSVRHLPLADQQWLADGDLHLLLPLVSGGALVGALALGEKLNDLPFSRDDQASLVPVAAALALTIDNLRLRDLPIGALSAAAVVGDTAPDVDGAAMVCDTCSHVAPAGSARCPLCGGALSATQLPAVLAGKFRLERELGRGGMGVVYQAFDTGLERRVAIKTLPRVSVAESVRLRREARAMAGFVHPNLALIFGIESWRGAPALVMEYLEGGTLAERLRRGPLPPDEAVALAYDLAGALALIHDAGMLHRDIKPSNIAFTNSGQPKLLDFGLAQMFVAAEVPPAARAHAPLDVSAWAVGADLTTVARLGAVAGTPAYMAPEAMAGESLDGGADLWSLGVVLFECLTGERPYTGRPSDARGTDWTGILRSRTPGGPPALVELVADLLADDKRKRPSSARAIRIRLGEQASRRVA